MVEKAFQAMSECAKAS